jgi:ankyrin repeat protein
MSSFPAQLRAAHTERLLRVATCVAASGHCGDLAPLLATARAFCADAQLWAALARHRGPRGRTRLMHAALEKDEARARFLLERGADANAADDGGETALMRACESDSLPVARLLVELGGADVNAADGTGYTALLFASDAGIVRFLVARGADVNVIPGDFYSQTALMLACERGDLESVKCLVERGADVNTPAGGNLYESKTALMFACHNGDIDKVRYLVEGLANVHAVSAAGMTPLMYACVYKRVEVARFLVEEGGAAVNAARAHDGMTALTYAAEKGCTEIARVLIAAGASVNAARTDTGTTALWLAC